MNTISKTDLQNLKDYLQKKIEGLPYEVPQDQFEQIRNTRFALAEYYKDGPLSLSADQYKIWQEGKYKIDLMEYTRSLEMIDSYTREHQY